MNTAMKRLFAAIKINPDDGFLSRFQDMQQAFQSARIKWVEAHNIHMTLKFFGETEEQKIPQIITLMNQRAQKTTPFMITLKGLGIFGSAYDPKIIWAGIEPYEALSQLMTSLHQELAEAGFEPDRQNKVPHLTLGRIRQLKDKEHFQKTLALYRNLQSAPEKVTSFILYESILRREGPEYRIVESFSLDKKNSPGQA
jgi:2'-5' RNA ligase